MNPNVESNIFYGVGMEHMEKEDYEKALLHFQKSLEIMRRSITAARIYECLVRLNRFAEARPYIEMAFMLNSNSDKIATQYAAHLIQDKETKKATIILRNALLKNPNNKKARSLLDSLEAQ